ncbi:MAG: 6-carboxytetrahydropterin synthase [Bacteroidaceae bacterium]|nr:6-carboxytetrahydropterin synthase [Bacteroidaceae bacterium]
MYYVSKTIEVSFAHKLNLSYESRCTNLHGHNARITVYCRAAELNDRGMVIDYSDLKRIVTDLLDHKYVNDLVSFNPTSENLARWICEAVPNCYKVRFQESEDNVAVYALDDDSTL